MGGDHAAGIGADDPRESAADHVFPRAAVRVLDEARHDLGVEGGLKSDTLLHQLGPQRVRVEKVAVVGDGSRTQRGVVERQWMRVLRTAGAGRRVSGVAQRDDRALAQLLELGRREDVGDKTHVAMHAHRRAVRNGDPRRLLAAVLQREKAEIGDVRHVDTLLGADSENSTHG